MTTSLVLDTSTSRTTVGIVHDGAEIALFHHDDPLAHGEVLPKLVAQALALCPVVDEVIVGMGPGPFTGLRVAIAFGQAFALAREIPCIGICSLDAIVPPANITDYAVATDARRKEVFWARYENGHRIGAAQTSSPITLKLLDIPIFGEGAIKYELSKAEHDPYPQVGGAIAAARSGAHYSAPIYVRRPDAFAAPKDVTFRPMNALDLVTIFDIEKRSYSQDSWSMAQLKEELASRHRWYLVAEKSGVVVGYVGGLLVDGVTDVLTLTVHPDFRRLGIARELLRRIIDWSRTQKAAAMMLEMRIGNIEAEPLYLAFGFVEISHRENYYGPGLTAIIMRKDLT